MDHAEAHELIADLALEPARLTGLASSTLPEDQALRAHVAGCDRCTAELAAWRRVQSVTSDALADTQADDLSRIAAPAQLRREVLNGVRAAAPRHRSWRLPRLTLRLATGALVLVIAAVGAIVVGNQSAQLNASAADRQALAAALATATRVMADPTHEAVTLNETGGPAMGMVAWSRHDLVVLATGLTLPPSGQAYRCWVVGGSGEMPVGSMDFVDGQAFWVGTLDEWASVDIGSAHTFEVTLESGAAPGATHTGPVMLEGQLGA